MKNCLLSYIHMHVFTASLDKYLNKIVNREFNESGCETLRKSMHAIHICTRLTSVNYEKKINEQKQVQIVYRSGKLV